MTDFYFNHDPANLPDYSEDCHPVQLFHTHLHDPNRHSLASKQLLQTVRGLGINIDEKAIDLITIATAVTAADTFEQGDPLTRRGDRVRVRQAIGQADRPRRVLYRSHALVLVMRPAVGRDRQTCRVPYFYLSGGRPSQSNVSLPQMVDRVSATATRRARANFGRRPV